MKKIYGSVLIELGTDIIISFGEFTYIMSREEAEDVLLILDGHDLRELISDGKVEICTALDKAKAIKEYVIELDLPVE